MTDLITSFRALGKKVLATGLGVALLWPPGVVWAQSPSCQPPASGTWTVSSDCTLTGTYSAPGDIEVLAGVTLTIAADAELTVDLQQYGVLIRHTGGILVKHGGTLRHGEAGSGGGGGPGITLIYHHEDHLTGANVDTDQNGAIVQLLDYYPYGDVRLDESSGGYENDYKFTGKEKDEDTGLYYYEARYYDSSIGRFVSRDTWEGELSDPQSQNRYSYVLNNPLKYKDETGNHPVAVAVAVVARAVFVGGVIGVGAQYTSDVMENFNNSSTSGVTNFKPRSNAATYVNSAVEGGTTAGFGARFGYLGAGISAVGISALGGESVEDSLTSGALEMLSGGVLKGVPKVRGRNPGLFSRSFFFGKHTQRDFAEETFSATLKSSVESLMNGDGAQNQQGSNFGEVLKIQTEIVAPPLPEDDNDNDSDTDSDSSSN